MSKKIKAFLKSRYKTKSFAEITKPLKEAAKKTGLKEEDVNRIIHEFRRRKKESGN